MLKGWNIIEQIGTTPAIADNKVVMYPTDFTDPCILPLEPTTQKEITYSNQFSQVTLYSPEGLPHGHYARLLIAFLTTIVRNQRPGEVKVARSISDLFSACTGKRMGGDNQKAFELVLEKVFTLCIHRREYIKSTEDEFDIRKSALISDYCCIRKNNGKMTDILFEPSESFRNLVKEKGAHPIDLRALQFFRVNDRKLAHDLYIFLSRKSVYLTTPSKLLTWQALKSVFPNAICSKDFFFKKKIREAVALIEVAYTKLNIQIIENKGLMIYKSPPHIPWKL